MSEFDYHENLIDAVKSALKRSAALIADEAIIYATHLSAQKRYNPDDSITWFVYIADDFDFPGVTNLSDNPAEWSGDAEAVARFIESVWDAEWDEIPRGRAVCDYSVGSTDFGNRYYIKSLEEYAEKFLTDR